MCRLSDVLCRSVLANAPLTAARRSPLPFKRTIVKAPQKTAEGTVVLLTQLLRCYSIVHSLSANSRAAEEALQQRRKLFQGDVERMRRCLQLMTLQPPPSLEKKVATLQRTVQRQSYRESREMRAEVAARAAAAAAAAAQEQMYGGANVMLDGVCAGVGMQLLLVEPVFEFYMGVNALLRTSASPLLLLHVQQRSLASLNSAGQAEIARLADSYLNSASLLSKLSMFGGSDADIAAAARAVAAAVSAMEEVLASPALHTPDLLRLLSLNAAHFLRYAPMVNAVMSVLVEQLQRCECVQHVLDTWPQLVQQCSPRFLDFLREPAYDVADNEIVPQPPARVCVAAERAEESSDDEDARLDDSSAMQLRDLHDEQRDPEPDSTQLKLTYQHFLHSVTVLSKEQRKVLLAARSLLTRAGIAWQLQQELVYCTVERMGRHIDVHTGCLELSNGRRLPCPSICPVFDITHASMPHEP